MADLIKVKSKKTYEWNQDTKFIYVRIPMPSHTSLKKIDIYLSDLILRVTSLQKKSTHFLDLVQQVDYKSPQNKFILSEGELHATLKKLEQTQWQQLLIEDISLADLKTRRRQSQARYEKNVKQREQIKDKLRDQYDRKATQQMMRFQQEQRKILDSKKQAQKDRAIHQIFSNVNQKTGAITNQKKLIQPISYQQKRWKDKQEIAMKMIMEEEQKEKNQLKNQKKLQNDKKIINQVQKQIGTDKVSASIIPSKSIFTQQDISSYDKMRQQVGETQYQQIPVRKANKIQVKFTQRIFPHLAARDTYVKQPPVPKQKDSKGNSEGDIQSKNPLWLKDKGDQFLRDKNYTSAIQAYTETIRIDSKMIGAWANRSLCNLRIFNFNVSISDCDQCLAIMQGKIGGSEQDNKKAIEFTAKIKTRKAMAKAWKGELGESKKQFEEILSDYQDLNPEVIQQIKKGIQSISLRQESISYKNKGDQQVKLCQYEKAINYYDQSISVDKNEYSISNKSLCLNKINSFSQSIQTTNEGIQKISQFNLNFTHLIKDESKTVQNRKPQTILLKLYYRKAKAFEQLNKIKQAQQTIHKGLSIDSTDKDFQTLLKQINIKKNKAVFKEQKQKAASLIKQGNITEALKIYTKCIKLIQNCDDIPQYLGILQNQCVCYLKINDYDSIVSTSIRILKIINNLQSKIVEFGDKKSSSISKQDLDKISVRTLMRRANAYLKKEQIYNAKSDLQKALEISPKDQTILKELNKIKELIGV